MSALRMEAIRHAYDGHPVVDGVSLDVGPNELVCLLGPSGCGKTTLLRLAAGLEHVQSGRILICGQIVADSAGAVHETPERRGTGLMFQDYALFPHMTIADNVRFGLHNGTLGERGSWVENAMERIGLERFARAYPHTLSGGQQQRAALLRAIAPGPRILLLDEPFSDLDVNRRIQVRDATLDLIKETGTATLMVTHDPEEAMFMSDRILVMENGRIVQSGTPFETYFNPNSAFVAALFGPVNRLEATVRGGCAETPLGSFDATNLADGTPAEVLIRVEGLKLDTTPPAAGQSPRVRLISARLLGRSTHVRIAVDMGRGREQIFQARVPGTFLPHADAAVHVTVDPSQAFVFPAPPQPAGPAG